jgi:E3 ubiquitin-protein ligase HECTD1
MEDVNKIKGPVFLVDNDEICLLFQMAEVDPETLLEWLNMGQGDERDMQLIALEQLCMLLLMSDNVDRCFER